MSKYEDEKEISIGDFLIEWLLHYKSLLVLFLLVFIIIAFSLIFNKLNFGFKFAFVMILVHFIIYLFEYLLNNKIKHYDNIKFYLGIDEFPHVINWQKFNNMNKYCKNLWNLRLKYEIHESYDDLVKINVQSITNLIRSNSYTEIAIIAFDLKKQGNELLDSLYKYNPQTNFVLLSSVSHNSEDMKALCECQSVVLLGKFRHTKYNMLYQEIESLKMQNKSVMGIILYE